jgi:hypothetical protein
MDMDKNGKDYKFFLRKGNYVMVTLVGNMKMCIKFGWRGQL